MKLVFSEARSDYAHYVFPYVIWAFPEPGETPGDFFEKGFLPSALDLSRYYLCRQVRVGLGGYAPSSENRRILRKGEGLEARLLERADFDYSPKRREFFKAYADEAFGRNVMSYERLDALFGSKLLTHVLLFTDRGADAGAVALHLEGKRLAYYYYAFYDPAGRGKSLGMHMMTAALGLLKERGVAHAYLGTCYYRGALYKTQFSGVEFFNGRRWSGDLSELKYLLEREEKPVTRHLLEDEDYVRRFGGR